MHLFPILLYKEGDHLQGLFKIWQLSHKPGFPMDQLLLYRLVGAVVVVELSDCFLGAATCTLAGTRTNKASSG